MVLVSCASIFLARALRRSAGMPRTVCFGPSMIYSMPRTEDHAPACNQTRKRQLFAEFATLPTFPRLIINQGIIKIHLIFHKSLKSSASTAAPWPTPTTRPTAWPTVWGHASHHVGMCRASCVTSCVLSTASLSNRTFLLSGPSVGTTPLSAPAPSLPSPTRCTSRSRGTDAFLCRTSTIPSFLCLAQKRRLPPPPPRPSASASVFLPAAGSPLL